MPGGLGTTYSDYLAVYNLGFSLPSWATVTGIVVEVEISEVTTGDTINIRCLLFSTTPTTTSIGGFITFNSYAVPGADSYKVFGDSANLWGAGGALTPTIVNSANFGVGVQLRATSGNTADDILVDHIRMTIYYTA